MKREKIESAHSDAGKKIVEESLQLSWVAFEAYRKKSLKARANFLRSIAAEMNAGEKEMIVQAKEETHLKEERLAIEFRRTILQLTSYADACEEGTWLDLRIDTAQPDRHPPKPDVRKMLVPLGPVVVFGASNFPFAYSTAGGDTACALAAGCPVIVKAHPAHAATSELVSAAITSASRKCKMPDGIFIHLHGSGFETGRALVEHTLTKAVGFTGSFEGGRALFDLANRRPVPIPVFAEMGSVNPVFFLPGQLQQKTKYFSSLFATSITQSAGQFCTKPGILVAIKGEALTEFKQLLAEQISQVNREYMLHPGIANSFLKKRNQLLETKSVILLTTAEFGDQQGDSIPTLAEVTAKDFISQQQLQQEVFGPLSLLVLCEDHQEMLQVAESMSGQLTCSIIATEEEMQAHVLLVAVLKGLCGRLIMNGVPTGVEVVTAMHHGGPFPATTDSRFTAVGADAIKRFARPLCLQNWDHSLLPDELKNENSLHLWRTINNQLTREPI